MGEENQPNKLANIDTQAQVFATLWASYIPFYWVQVGGAAAIEAGALAAWSSLYDKCAYLFAIALMALASVVLYMAICILERLGKWLNTMRDLTLEATGRLQRIPGPADNLLDRLFGWLDNRLAPRDQRRKKGDARKHLSANRIARISIWAMLGFNVIAILTAAIRWALG